MPGSEPRGFASYPHPNPLPGGEGTRIRAPLSRPGGWGAGRGVGGEGARPKKETLAGVYDDDAPTSRRALPATQAQTQLAGVGGQRLETFLANGVTGRELELAQHQACLES